MPSCDPDKFVDRKNEIEFIKDKVSRLARGTPFEPEERVAHFVGPSGIGKSCFLDICYITFDKEPNCVPILINLETIANRSDRFVSDFLLMFNERFLSYKSIKVDKLSGSLIKDSKDIIRKINQYNEDILTLLLDEIDTPQKEVQSLEQHLLYGLLHSNKRVVLITAGRTPPMLNEFALRPSSANIFQLSPFDEKTTGEQLDKLKPGSRFIAPKAIELGGGIPGNTAKLVGFVAGQPPAIAYELEAVQSLRTDPKYDIDDRYQPAIEAICILSDFIPEDLIPLLKAHPVSAIIEEGTSHKDVFFNLRKIRIGPGGLITWDTVNRVYVLDESVRRIYEQELRLRDPELWRKLHCTAHKMYKDWGEELDSDVFRVKADFHLKRLQEYGMDCKNVDQEG